jgi:ribosomal protein S18 acetylase RimI-like enzyme
MNPILQVRQALPSDMAAIIDMIDEAADWLRGRNTDQWAQPYPNRKARDARVRRGLQAGKTWLVEDVKGAVATVTSRQEANPKLWRELEQADRAVYLSRLIVRRRSAGQEIGAKLIDWAAHRAVKQWGAQWIRIDVWTTNDALQQYYRKLGFEFCRFCPDAAYPSAALFQKSTAGIKAPEILRTSCAEPVGRVAPTLPSPAVSDNASCTAGTESSQTILSGSVISRSGQTSLT